MIQINKIASSSSGNAISVSDGRSTILLDCGLPYSRLSRQVNMSEVDGVLLTHFHMDHAKAAEELLRRGTEVYMSLGTADALGFGGSIMKGLLVKHLKQFEVGGWKVLPFDVIHDAPEPLGFLFQSKSNGAKGLYIVDSAVVDYSFKGVTHWLIEANFSQNGLDNSSYPDVVKRRIQRNHFSFENLVTFLTTSDLSQTEEIHLLHLSDANSNEKQFVEQLQKRTGVPVYV